MNRVSRTSSDFVQGLSPWAVFFRAKVMSSLHFCAYAGTLLAWVRRLSGGYSFFLLSFIFGGNTHVPLPVDRVIASRI